MKFIAHRGNTAGPNPELENHPDYVTSALQQGYDVEIDVYYENNEWWLGHDTPDYKVDVAFIKQPGLWCHAKDLHTLSQLIKLDVVCFFHDSDDGVITSNKYIWTYPGKTITDISIAVMPEWVPDWDYSNCYAVCSDYISKQHG